MFNAQPILIVEDEFLIAMDLADAVSDLDGAVIGPLDTVRAALENLENRTIAGAIVDVNLRDRDIMPVIHALIAANIPFVVYTANGLPPEFTRQNPFLPVMLKPSYAPDVARRLLDEMVRHRPAG